MVITDAAAQTGRPQNAEAIGKFIPSLPGLTAPKPATTTTRPDDTPIRPKWAEWR